jgi:predicted dehydrogenase
MTQNPTRRSFVKTGAAALSAAPSILAQRNPNDRLGVAVIGVGTRGIYLLERFQECPNTEIRAICDLYQPNMARAQKTAFNKKAKTYLDYEKAIADPDVDVVVIATPDFWHAKMAVAAAKAKKPIYVEKGLCVTLQEAKDIRNAVKEAGVPFQLGHHQNSDPWFVKAKELYATGQLGKTCVARTYIDRTNPWPEWQFYTAYDINETPKEAGPDTIDWERFQAQAPKKHQFDVQRFFRWRCWWEYGTGIAGDLMSHQWDGVNMIVGMGIPESCITQGGLYFWKNDRDVPDQWHVVFDYPGKEMSVSFGCSFHNRHQGTNTYILGRDASIEVHTGWCRLYEGEWKPEATAKMKANNGVLPPLYEMKRGELEVTSHMRDLIDCIRSGKKTRCDIDRAWEEAVTIMMSIESYRRETKVKWDPRREEIV